MYTRASVAGPILIGLLSLTRTVLLHPPANTVASAAKDSRIGHSIHSPILLANAAFKPSEESQRDRCDDAFDRIHPHFLAMVRETV